MLLFPLIGIDLTLRVVAAVDADVIHRDVSQ